MDKKKDHCELLDLFNLLGKKWTIEILHNINDKPISFNQLYVFFGHKISPILLSKRLKELENFSFINRKEIDKRIIYIISSRGKEVKKNINMTRKWLIRKRYKVPAECKKEDQCLRCIQRPD